MAAKSKKSRPQKPTSNQRNPKVRLCCSFKKLILRFDQTVLDDTSLKIGASGNPSLPAIIAETSTRIFNGHLKYIKDGAEYFACVSHKPSGSTTPTPGLPDDVDLILYLTASSTEIPDDCK